MDLSICLITRNHQETLERALRSVASLGAEVIVGDTGSSDQTVAVAESFGACVEMIDWQDDFGAGQNAVVDLATRTWVFWLNPDEELLSVGLDRLSEYLTNSDVLAYAATIQEVSDPSQLQRVMETVHPRLVRRLPQVRFTGRLHPHYEPNLGALAASLKMKLVGPIVTLRHHRYASTLTPEKIRWTVRLLEKELQDRPGQVHYLIELGRDLLLLDDPRGHDVLAEATDALLKVRENNRPPTLTVGSLLEYLLSVDPAQAKVQLPFAEIRELAERWFADSPPVVWSLAQKAFRSGDYASAARWLDQLLLMGRTGNFDRSTAFDPEILAEPALLNLGRCCAQLGQLDHAASCFGQLLTHPKYAREARQGFAYVEELRKKIPASPK